MLSDTDNTNQQTVEGVGQTDQNQNQPDDGVGTSDYEMLHKNEVEYNKKLRNKNQSLEDELSKYKLEKENNRQNKMEEEGKYKELLTERDATIKDLTSKVDSANTYFEGKRQSILDTFSDEDKEAFGDLPLAKLEVIQKKFSTANSNPKNVPEGLDKSTGEFGGYSSMEEWAMKDPKGYQKANNNLTNGGIKIGYM